MKISNEAYRPLLEVLGEYRHARATINISGVLTEMLWECGHSDIITKLKRLAEGGKIEFTGSAKYHPVLPLIPAEEMERQIRSNHLANRYFLGDVYSPRGFFPPELCYSRDIVEPVVESRHEWIIVSGVACPAAWPMNVIHEISYEEERLAVFFRDDILSNKISFRDIDGKGFIDHLRQLYKGEGDIYVITAMDAETFGHHIQHWEKLFLAEVYETLEPVEAGRRAMQRQKPLAEQHRKLFDFQKDGEIKQIEIVTISQLLDIFPKGSRIEPRPSSWSTTADDLKARNYYPLWKGKDNPVHQLQWEHLSIAVELVHKAIEVANNPTSRHFASIARSLLDPSFHSCQFWWASKRPMWDINMINRGLNLQREVLLNAYKAISTSGCDPQIKKDYYYKMIAARTIADKISDSLMTE